MLLRGLGRLEGRGDGVGLALPVLAAEDRSESGRTEVVCNNPQVDVCYGASW